MHSSTPSQSGSQTAEAEEKPAVESPPVETGFRPAAPRPLQIGFGLAALVLAIVILYLIRDVLGAFVLGTLIAFLITPAVDRMHQAGIPRAVAILVLFGVIIGVLAALVSAVLPLLTDEFEGLRRQAPAMAAAAQARLSALQGQPLEILGFRVDLTKLTNTVSAHANDFLLGQFGNALSIGITALTMVFQGVLMLAVAFLVAMDTHSISRVLRTLVPNDYRGHFDAIWKDIKLMLYAYIRGQLIIAVLIGIASGIAIQVLGLPYALALGLVAAITSLVPYLGPFLGAIPAVLIGLAQSPQKALLVAVAYLVISNLILNLVFPKVMGDAVRLSPLLVITAFIAGYSLGGILGMFIAIPIAATLRILYDHVHAQIYGPEPQSA